MAYNNSLMFFQPPAGGAPATGGFNPAPSPQSGVGPFGMVPGNISVAPAYGAVNQPQIASVINSQLNGELSPAEQAAIQDAGARFGVTSGMPGSGLARNRTVRDFGIATGVRQNQGIQNFNSLVPGAAYQTGVQEQNAVNAASPNPAAAASYSQQLFNQYLQSMRGPGGGTRGTGDSNAWRDSSNPNSSNYSPSLKWKGNSYFDRDPLAGWGEGDGSASLTGPEGTYYADPSLSGFFPADYSTFGSPAGTVNADTNSYYDPLAEYGDFGGY